MANKKKPTVVINDYTETNTKAEEPTPPRSSETIPNVIFGLFLLFLGSGMLYFFRPPLEHWKVTIVSSRPSSLTVRFDDGQTKLVQFKDAPNMEDGSVWDIGVRKSRYSGDVVGSYRIYGARELKLGGMICESGEEATFTTDDFKERYVREICHY